MSNIFTEIDLLQEKINASGSLSKEQPHVIKEYYRVLLTYSSNALEGNSLTITETKIIIEDGMTIGGKPLRDTFEAVGHSDAYDYVYTCIQNKNFSQATIKKLHHLFYYRIDEKNAGVYRNVNVMISGSAHQLPRHEKVANLMHEFIEYIDKKRASLHPAEYAAQVHKQFVFVHPFIDGNGRVARLLMNLVLLQAGYCIAIIPPILRRDYINALEKARTNDRDFIIFIAQQIKETQRDYLRLLH